MSKLGVTLFSRPPGPRSPPGGSGLGLTIAHNFITQHRGAITFDSVPGRTSFTLLLPVQDDPRAGTPAQPH